MLVAATLYLLTLDNGLRPGELAGGDLITHQYAQVQGRPSNAPGYPLYTMGGWLWFHGGRLILGNAANPIPILSSYSTLWALLALWLLYRLTLEVTDRGDGGNWPVAALVTGFYAVTYFFWYYAVTTEEYTSAAGWTLAVFWLAFRWQRTRRDGYLLGIAFLAGCGLAHILTILLVIPPLLWFVLSEEPALLRRPRLVAAAVGLAALPLLSYVFVYVRGAQHPEWRGAGQWDSTWQWFLSFISTRQGWQELTWSWTPLLTAEFPRLIWQELTIPGLALGLAGLIGLGRRRAIAVCASLALYLVFCWIDRRGNWFQVIMPAYALLAMGTGVAADRIERHGSRRPGRRSPRSTPAAPGHLAGPGGPDGIPGRCVLSCSQLAEPPDDTGLVPGWAILADRPAPGSAILGTLPETLSANYLTQIWGLRPDLQMVTSDQARQILASGRRALAVTVGRFAVGAGGGQRRGPLQRVRAHAGGSAGHAFPGAAAGPGGARTPRPELRPWTYDFGSGLRLAGGRLVRDAVTGETVVWLVWQAQDRHRPATGRYRCGCSRGIACWRRATRRTRWRAPIRPAAGRQARS